MKHNHSKHNLGHSLFTLGVAILIVSVTILSPLNAAVSFAIGAEKIAALSNQARGTFDAPALQINSSLMSAAQAKAEDMAKNKYFAHFAPDGTTPWDFFKQVGYNYAVAGENLAITNEDETAVINGWLNSPTHKENLISTAYNEFGIGIAKFGDYKNNKDTTVVVALYGMQKSKLSVTGAEPTNPAGTVAVLRPAILGEKLYSLVGLGIALIIAGVALEIRHLKRHAVHPKHEYDD